MQKTGRRDFLRAGIGAAVAAGSPWPLATHRGSANESSPKINARAGRDHWGHSFSLALAGGGIRGGAVHGVSDKHAAYPLDGIVRPRDVIATVFHCLGYPPETEIRDQLGRPLPISRGRVIEEIV